MQKKEKSANILILALVLFKNNMIKKIKINVQEPYYSLILNGKKNVEGRLNKGKFAQIEVGDILIIGEEKNEFIVIDKKFYSSFQEMIESEKIENVIPDKKTISEAVNVYYQFYTPEQEKEFGVVAIKIK